VDPCTSSQAKIEANSFKLGFQARIGECKIVCTYLYPKAHKGHKQLLGRGKKPQMAQGREVFMMMACRD
jgi:hypothetical protein